MTIALPSKLETLLDSFDKGILNPDDELELVQWLIDTGLCEEFTQYQRLCDYYVLEGLCYDVGED